MMNRIFKKACSLIIITAFALTLTAQSWAVTATANTIGLQGAIDSAIKNNTNIKLTDDKIKVAERRYNTAVAVGKTAATKYWGSDQQRIANVKEETLYPMQREDELNDLKWQKDDITKKLKLDVSKLYYQALDKQAAADGQL